MPLTKLQVGLLAQRYEREFDRYLKMAAFVEGELRQRLSALTIPALVTHRAKKSDSFQETLSRKAVDRSEGMFADELSEGLADLAGVRVLLYRPEDEDPVVEEVQGTFQVLDGAGALERHKKESGYVATHILVRLTPEQLSEPSRENLERTCCEIQVVHFLDHIFNELEHDIVYKTPTGEPTPEQKDTLAMLRSSLDTAKLAAGKLMEQTARAITEATREIGSGDDLRRVLETRHGRVLRGDFSRLHHLLTSTHRDTLTPADLDELPLSPEDLDAARASLAELDVPDRERDVALMLASLWPTLGRDFLDIAESWPGRPNVVKRTLQHLGDGGER